MHTCNTHTQLSHHLCMVLLYDLLLGKGIQCGGPVKRFLLSHKVDLFNALRESTDNKSNFSVESSGINFNNIIV